ncbi:precorrin-2/cobalt-factor-2 C20-methyltransferase [Meinhardsimonia xiamenensis]|jgi:precorrin-2/cobalt-factor-2 C20-methyltransferase|uniref:Precorrin-2/cobalt-factor-2 C20-methyltransferase n=1 Tax=Meinhardsimonia xiamenensis TaxID=990712 RepID=A0A1G8XQG0_9RHOB|nr:precorrin-2 C(20)-methyltransferase [Meinhardsimonia xiamenensis]PRX37005.1 precorrin-2/cobalt-factor-2 C20-methyltransferase [Meinhardsimonia xiamenensis]SDJ92809.1 precorrin-2/cobalt-factor-2 C20-methyltransferase [Meinhardsimonia xiamenensis]
MSGTLYGIGVGPGDPELLTLKALRLIEQAEVVAYPCLPGAESFARSVVAAVIPAEAREIAIEVPMTSAREPAQAAYDAGAARIGAELEAERDVVCLCEGDPLFYGSFMYLHARLASRFEVVVVPGVTSLTACAAAAGRPLVARNEALTVLPGPLSDEEMRRRLEGAETVAIMKVGRHLPRLRALLAGEGLADKAVYVERATLGVERVCPLGAAPDEAPYFSMVLVTKGADPWL